MLTKTSCRSPDCDTSQKMNFSIKDFFSKCDQIGSFLRIWSHLLKKSLMEKFIFLCSASCDLQAHEPIELRVCKLTSCVSQLTLEDLKYSLEHAKFFLISGSHFRITKEMHIQLIITLKSKKVCEVINSNKAFHKLLKK